MAKLTIEQLEKKETVKAKRKEFVKQVSEMSKEQLADLKERIDIVTCEGKHLSPRNCMLLDLQGETLDNPVTCIGGYRQWESLNRVVKQGEGALTILAPRIAKDKSGSGEITDKEGTKMFFQFVSVFDIQQTQEMEIKEKE